MATQSLLYHIITARDVDELENLYVLVVEDALRLHWEDTRCIPGDAERRAVPRRVPHAPHQHALTYADYETAMYHMRRVKGDRTSEAPAVYALRVMACILFACHVSVYAYILLYTYGRLNDVYNKPAPSYSMATQGFVEFHDIATFYRSVFGIDPETHETREMMRAEPRVHSEGVLAFCKTMRTHMWFWSTMDVAPPHIGTTAD